MELGPHVIVGMLVRPDNPDIVYITTWGDGGYMSNNGGATWIRMKIPSIYQGYISIYKLDPNIMCIGTTQGAYKSTDSGNNWKHYLPEADIISIAIHPSNPDIMYVNFSRLGIFKTTDGGNSWKSTYSNITNRRIYAIAIHPDKPDTLIAGVDCPDFFTDIPAFGTYKSINGGLSWNESGPDSIVNKGNPTTVAFAVDWLDHDMIYSVVPGRGVFVSQDFGDNWWKVQNSGLDIRQFNTLVMDPNDNLTLYMGAEYVSELDNDKGIFKTTDGGANWRRFNQGLTDKRIKCLAMSSDSMLYAGTASGVFRIAKDSNQWERAGLDGQEVKALITSPREPSIVYAGTWGGGVYKSTDYGKIWVRKNSGLKNWNIYGLDIAKKNPDILYVGTEGGVFLSVDGSESWQDISEGLPPINTRIGPIVIDQQRPHIVYAATDYGVYCYEGNQLPAAVKSKGKLADNWSSIKNVDMPNVSESKPMKSMLYPNYPNPFNPETWIPYQIDKGTDCSIHIYDASGRIVRVLNIGYKPAGFYTSQDKAIYWDGKNELGEVVASGIYFYTIKAGEFVDTKKMIIVR
ncbi:TPA: T9SS type A sorting domain-containing protein [bacterium]|nr:T9SS type A sorting domain-containing protein [bacterium]